MKKLKLFFACLLMSILSIGQVWGADVITPTSGSTYRIKATKSNTTYYLVAPTSTGLGGVSTNQSEGTVFTFTQQNSNWYITFVSGSTTYYMSENSNNGRVTIGTSATAVAIGTNGNYTKIGSSKWIQLRGDTPDRIGCYSSSQAGCVLEETGGGSQQTTPLSEPTGMSSGTPGMTSATLSWNPVEHADSYALTIGTNDAITTGFETVNNKITYTLNNLEDATTYTWKVKATTTHTDTYSNSADCAEQQFTTASDPNKLKVTYDFKNDTKPDGFPTATGTSTTTATEFTFGSNKLTINAPSAYYIIGSEALFFGQTTSAYLEFPAKANYKLTKVVVTPRSGCAGNVSTNIYNTSGTAVSTAVNTNNAGNVMTFDIAQDKQAYNTAYQLKSTTNSKNYQFTKIVLTYAPKPAVSSISIKNAPSKTTYTANETFNPAGMVITVNYSDNTSEDVAYNNTTASDFTFSPTTSTALNATNSSVTVTYATKTANQSIIVNRIATTLSWSANSYAANIGSQYSFPTLTKTPSNLSGVTYSSSETSVATINATTGAIEVQGTGETTITAAFAQTNVYAAATSATYTLTINAANSPALEVDPTSLTFDLTEVGQSSEKEFALQGEYLTANASLAITGDDKDMFSVTSSVAKDGDGNILEDVTVTYSPTAAGNHSATLTISSTDATPVEVALSGSANVRRSVTWVTGTGASAAGGTASVWDGDAITAIPTQPTSCDEAISFMGWTDAIYAKSDDAPAHLYHQVSDFPAISGGNATYYAVWAEVDDKNGSVVLNSSTENFPDTYGTTNDFDDAELEGYDFKIQQVYVNGNKLQWRASGNKNGTGTIYNNEVFLGHISTVVVVFTNDDTGMNHTLKIGNSANPTSGTEITPSTSGSTYTFDCSSYNYDYFVLTNGAGAGYTESVTINFSYFATKNYSTTCSAPVNISAPTFTVDAGTYADDQSVEINYSSPATTVYYTTDGTNPKTSGTKQTYSSAISVTEDMTIKAIATDGNDNWSEEATAAYKINYSTSIAAFIEKAQNTARALKLNAAQNAIITGIREYVSSNTTKYDIYMQDASNKGIIIYGLTALPEGAAANKKIVGTINGTYALSYGQYRITGATFAEGIQFEDASVVPASIDAVNADAYAANPIMLVKLSGVYYNTGSYYFTSQAEGQGTSNYIYDTFKTLDGKTMPANTDACDITGILIKYETTSNQVVTTTYELLPLSLTLANATDAVLPAIDPEGGADSENAVEVTYLSTVSVPLVENEKIYVSVNDAEATDPIEEAASIQIEGDVKLTVTAKRDFYADNSVTYYYKPSAYPKSITKVSAHGTMTVKVGEVTVETALPTSTVNVTISNVADHFTLTGITVNNGSVDVSGSAGNYSFTMPNADVTITANYDEDYHYTITYATSGDATGDAPTGAPTWQYAGEDVTLLANSYTWDDDHSFTGWKVTYNDTELDKSVGSTFQMPAANVTITAQWAEKQYCALTLKVNGENYLVKNIEQDVEQTISDLDGYVDPEDVGDYEFFGWAATTEDDDVEDVIATIETYTPEVGETAKTLHAVFKRVYEGAEKTDVLTADDFNATGNGYVEFSDVQKLSAAKYAGKTAKNSTNIQINKKAENGFYSSVSGGIVKSVTITMTSDSKKLGVYGSNSGFTGYTGIPSQTGVSVIEEYASTASKTITPSAEYKYIGFASKDDGAKYIASVSITWQPKVTYYTTLPAEVYDVTYNLGTSPAGAWKENEGCEGSKVKSGLTYDICEDEPIREHFNFNGWLVGGQAASGTITITGNTEIVANWVAKVESTLTYDKGTASGINVVTNDVEESTEITLPAIGTGEGQVNFTKEGYDFKGWLYNNKLYKAGETFEMPATDATLVAQWKKQNTEKFTLVTDASQLLDGSKVVLANQANEAVAGESAKESDTYLASETATFNDTKSIITNIGDGIQLTLVQMADGWALEYNGKYLKPYSTNKVAWDANPTKWYISISENNATIETGLTDGSALRYNSNSNSLRFAAYSNKTTCDPIQLYASSTVVTESMNISNLGYVENEAIVASGDNTTLTIDVTTNAQSITVKEGATVVIEEETTADDVIVKNGGKVIVSENKALEAKDLIIQSTSGAYEVAGASGQLIKEENASAAVNGDIYLEIQLRSDAMDAEASRKWYCISAPFDVAINGGFFWGDGTPMVLNTDFQLFEWDGARRASGSSGWRRTSSNMKAHTAYFIGFDDERTNQNTIKLKAMNKNISSEETIDVKEYNTNSAGSDYENWNGLGNPRLHHIALDQNVQAFNYNTQTYSPYPAGQYNFIVGTPFFIKGTTDLTIGEANNAEFRAPKREGKDYMFRVRIGKSGEAIADNHVYVRASEAASTSYEEGHDMPTMNDETSKYSALIWTKNYGMRLAIEEAPLVDEKATYELGIFAPAAGAYSISVASARENADLYLTYEGSIIWNLSEGEYTADLAKGSNTGYGLLLVKKVPMTPTGVDNVQSDKVQCTKVILDEKVFILRGGQMYDVTGKAVK